MKGKTMKGRSIKHAYAAILAAVSCLAVPRLSAQEPVVTNITVNVTNNSVFVVSETEVIATVAMTNLTTYVGPAAGSGFVAANWDLGVVPTNTIESVHGYYDVLDVSSLLDHTDCVTNWIEELGGYGEFTTNYWTLQTNAVEFVTNRIDQYDISVDGNAGQNGSGWRSATRIHLIPAMSASTPPPHGSRSRTVSPTPSKDPAPSTAESAS
jgi:hypothetical protein